MLNPEDRRAIEGLFSRLRDVEHRAEPRDPEAEALIREEISRQPGAPYYMAQTVLVQEHALSVAERRIAELEEQLQRRPNDFLGGLLGTGAPARTPDYAPAQRERGPWDRRPGGFLAGAAQTALGVTGGLLLGSAIGSMFGVGAAQAQDAVEPADQDPGQDAADADAGGDDLDGGDFGGDGLDFGGDF